MPEKYNHVHKYKRTEIGGRRIVREMGRRFIKKTDGYPVFKCMIPDCPHYLPMALALGRKSICWRCGRELVIDEAMLNMAKPSHKDCAKAAKETEAA